MKSTSSHLVRFAASSSPIAVLPLLLLLACNPAQALDLFKCYRTPFPQPAAVDVLLDDQFLDGYRLFTVEESVRFCSPEAYAQVYPHSGDLNPIQDPDAHLKLYRVSPYDPEPARIVKVDNYVGNDQVLTVDQPEALAVPAQRVPLPSPNGLDHFLCYRASGQRVGVRLKLRDDLHNENRVTVLEPTLFCNPATKVHDGVVHPIQWPDSHLTCYAIKGTPFSGSATVVDQFGTEDLDLVRAGLLCVPTFLQGVGPCQDSSECQVDERCDKADGDCTGTGVCEFRPPPSACSYYDPSPVCGCNGQTFTNFCFAWSAGESIACQNACPCQ